MTLEACLQNAIRKNRMRLTMIKKVYNHVQEKCNLHSQVHIKLSEWLAKEMEQARPFVNT